MLPIYLAWNQAPKMETKLKDTSQMRKLYVICFCSCCSPPLCSSVVSVKKNVSFVSGSESEGEDSGVPVMNREIQDPALYKTYVDLPVLRYVRALFLVCIVLLFSVISAMFMLSLDGVTLNPHLEQRSRHCASFSLRIQRGVPGSNSVAKDFAFTHLL